MVSMMVRVLLAVVLVWPMVGVADFEEAKTAYARGNYETAYREWLPLAEAGDTRAQYNLGQSYRTGQGVPQDDQEAVRWYRMAAEQGHAQAQYNLGFMYGQGHGVPQDDQESVRWFRMAAEQGNADAQNALGVMHADGQGVPQDDQEAVKWYRMAAEQGNAGAQYNLGQLYRTGEGVPQYDEEAVKWYRMAADQGFAQAQSNLGFMYADGRGVPQDSIRAYSWWNLAASQGEESAAENKEILSERMTRGQIAEAQQLSRVWLHQIERGEPISEPTDSTRALVAEAQILLLALGYEPGPADGIPGARTASAVRAFQSDLGLTPTGVVSEELVALLRIQASAREAIR